MLELEGVRLEPPEAAQQAFSFLKATGGNALGARGYRVAQTGGSRLGAEMLEAVSPLLIASKKKDRLTTVSLQVAD